MKLLKNYHPLKFLEGRDRTREMVRIRDNYTCQICKKSWEIGKRRFDVHHLDCDPSKTSSYDKISDLPLLITLCHKCHLQLTFDVEKLKSFTKQKIQERKITHIKITLPKYKFSILSKRNSIILDLKNKGHSTKYISHKYGITRQRINQICQKLSPVTNKHQ